MTSFIQLTILICALAFQGPPKLMKNSVGVAYLKTMDEQSIEIEVVFPHNRLLRPLSKEHDFKSNTLYTFDFDGTFQLFDIDGVIGTIQLKEQLSLEFWCDNDGGTQFRPTCKIRIPKDRLDRDLPTANPNIQNIVSFVAANVDGEFTSQTPDPGWHRDIVLQGDLNGDGIVDARIGTTPDDAENCDGNPRNNLMIYLDANGQNNRIRCCGP